VERRLGLMGTTLSLEVAAASRPQALAASEAAVKALEAAETRLSTWRSDSELARLNAAPAGTPVPLSPILAGELARAVHWWRETGGAFDPGVGALVSAWDLRHGGRLPSDAEIRVALSSGGLRALRLEGRNATRLVPGLLLEEGGFGKGAGLDAAARALEQAGAAQAVLDLGGQMLLFGERGEPYATGLADPRDRARPVLKLAVAHGSLATSGNSEHGIEVGGRRFGHLLDPRTGRPAPDFGSVTVWAPDALTADCLSTGLFVMGPAAALEWARAHAGIEIVVLEITPQGGLHATATPGWKGRLEPLVDDLPLTLLPATPQDPRPADAAQHGDGGQDLRGELEALKKKDAELDRRLEILAAELERRELGTTGVQAVQGRHGLAPAASKVYAVQPGVSIGGYGELLYQNFKTTTERGAPARRPDQFDLERAVLYFGYKFNEQWVFNSEIEIEHAASDDNGEVSAEFAYLDFLMQDEVNFRAGLLLIPMGFLNEMHEPTTFLSAARPMVERVLIPTTWRENGIGVFGDIGPVTYRSYLVNGFDAAGFKATGLRGGRQNGSKAKAENFASVTRVDVAALPGLTVGGSLYYGDSAQDLTVGKRSLDAGTTLVEGHLEWKHEGFRLRGLLVHEQVNQVRALNRALGLTGARSIGDRLDGWYVEAGYDLLAALAPDSEASLTPFVRWESFDTQSSVPAGFKVNQANDVDVLTLGAAWQPMPQVILKLDFENIDTVARSGVNRISAAIGYIF